MELIQTASASRPRSRSQVLHSFTSASQTSKEDYETFSEDYRQERSRRTVSKSLTPDSSETRPASRATRQSSKTNSLKDEFEKRYKIDLMPEIQQLRIAGNWRGYRLTGDVLKPRKEKPYVSLGVKMAEDPRIVKKIVVTPQHSDVRAFSPPIELGFLRLQIALGYDWKKGNFAASWRCKTKWTNGSKIQKRFEILNRDYLGLQTFWNLRQEFPQMGGMIGPSSSSFTPDIGRLHFSLHRIKASVNI